MRVKFWGTRGSIPTPGRHTVHYGGNTSCVEVRASGRTLILDAGSGIRCLGLEKLTQGPLEASVLLTHVHWDHIQGFPFFAPAYIEDSSLDVYGLPVCSQKVDLLLSNQMETIYFPVDLASMRAQIRFHDLNRDREPVLVGGVQVALINVNHTTDTVGFRIEDGGASVVYIPDNEIAFCERDGCTSYEDLVEFCAGADLLIHDAQYTQKNYEHHRGWGHSTREEAVRLAVDAGARRLAAFHHDPQASDETIAAWEKETRARLAAEGSTLDCFGAREGAEIEVG